MSYAAAVHHLYALGQELAPPPPGTQRRKFDLAHMRALTAALGHPERATPAVLIAGTNGKGSTSATLAAILAAAGYRVGLYTSPHLLRVNERIQLSTPVAPTEYSSADAPGSAGPAQFTPIADDDFARLYFRVDSTAEHLVSTGVLPHTPSFFERLTAVAFLYFAERRAEIAVLEVGLGGRLDATNIVDPLLSVITDIALDHQEYLGDTIAAITREKAGILREGGTLITLPQHPEANQALGEIAATLPGLKAISAADLVPSPSAPRETSVATAPPAALAQLPSLQAGAFHDPESTAPSLIPNRYAIAVDGAQLNVDSPLPGVHQQRNIALAIAAARELRNSKGYKIPNAAIEDGIRATVWPGRLQSISLPGTDQTVLLDVAHNPAGAWTLRAAIAALPAVTPRTLLFSCLRDKDLGALTQILFPLFDATDGDPDRHRDHIVLAPIESPRAVPAIDLLAAAHRLNTPAHVAPHVAAALAQAVELTPRGGIIVATGSIALVGAVLSEVDHLGLDRAHGDRHSAVHPHTPQTPVPERPPDPPVKDASTAPHTSPAMVHERV